MTGTPAAMRDRLAILQPQLIEIIDESHLHAGHAGARSGGGHFRLKIVSERFGGMNSLARQRLIYQTLGDLMSREIHALSIDARAPDQP